jgi:hypothetical protein
VDVTDRYYRETVPDTKVWHVRMKIERNDGGLRESFSKLMTYTEAKKILATYERVGYKCVIVQHTPRCSCLKGRHAVERKVAKIEEE